MSTQHQLQIKIVVLEQNYILRSVGDTCCVILLLLDMPAAFDTVQSFKKGCNPTMVSQVEHKHGSTHMWRTARSLWGSEELHPAYRNWFVVYPRGLFYGPSSMFFTHLRLEISSANMVCFSMYMQMTSNCIPLCTLRMKQRWQRQWDELKCAFLTSILGWL